MKYKIEKISLTKEEANKLIGEIISEINKYDYSVFDKRKTEIYLHSEDELIDIWVNVEFFSDYRAVNGGVETISRTVTCDIKFTDNEKGNKIDFDCPVSLDEAIQEHFRID